jgi:hypothetical protein
MTALEYALSYAAAGLPVFPIAPDTKIPVAGIEWKAEASTNPQKIKHWAAQYPDCNWAVHLGKAGLAVLDIDPPEGFRSYDELQLQHGPLPDTFAVRTPRGGQHHYYGMLTGNSVGKLGPNLDVKSINGYVLLPGSKTPDGVYTVEPTCPAVYATPDPWFKKMCGEKALTEKPQQPQVIESTLNPTGSIIQAMNYLKSEAPEAIEGSGGDQTTFNVACYLKEISLSPAVALGLMWEVYNNRCSPPWTYEELKRKVYNAYQYSQQSVGVNDPRQDFSVIEDPSKKNILYSVLRESFINNVRRSINWLVEGLIEIGSTGVIFGDPGTYKSFVTLGMSSAVSVGAKWCGRKTQKGGVLYIAGEGQRGIGRRLLAHEQFHGINGEEGIIELTNQAVQMLLNDYYKALQELIEDFRKRHGAYPALIVLDTLARNMGGNENSTEDMSEFIARVERLGDKDTAKIILQHTGHDNKQRPRGSIALTAAADQEYRLSRDTNIPLSSATLHCTKMKDADEPGDIVLKPELIELGADDNGKLITSLALRQLSGEEYGEIYAAENATDAKMKLVLTLKINNEMTIRDITDQTGLPKNQIERLLAQAIEQKIIGKTGEGKNVKYYWL